MQDEFRQGKAADRKFKAMDKNKDGKISREEWYERYGTYDGFDEYDLDGDGFVDPGNALSSSGEGAQCLDCR